MHKRLTRLQWVKCMHAESRQHINFILCFAEGCLCWIYEYVLSMVEELFYGINICVLCTVEGWLCWIKCMSGRRMGLYWVNTCVLCVVEGWLRWVNACVFYKGDVDVYIRGASKLELSTAITYRKTFRTPGVYLISGGQALISNVCYQSCCCGWHHPAESFFF